MNIKSNLKRLSLLALSVSFLQTPGFGADESRLATPPVESRFAPEFVGLAKLLQSGVDQKVVLTYITTAPPRRTPSADELVRLHELGLSTEGMVALLNGSPKVPALQEPVPTLVTVDPRAAQPQNVQVVQRAPASSPDLVAASQAAAATPVVTQQPTVVYTQPAPQTIYVESPPVVSYVRPYPAVSFGIGLGLLSLGHHFAWHHGGHHGHYGRHR